MSVTDYVTAFTQKCRPSSPLPVVGRIIRGRNPEDFRTLTDDPENRKVVMLFDEAGMHELIERDGRSMLLDVAGYEPSYLQGKLDVGFTFKIVAFEPAGAELATWDGVLRTVAMAYPDIATMTGRHAHMLKSMTFAEIEQAAEYRFCEVEQAGADDPRFMTYERYRRSRGTLIETRAFLYFTLHLRELFAGDGYTRNAAGERGAREYFTANRPVADLPNVAVIDLQVT